MPLYEGIGFTEKTAVILDIGTAYTKLGFAGEEHPRSIIRSEVKSSRTGKIVKVHSTTNPELLHNILVDFIHLLYFRYLQVNPKERKVVIVESVLCPTVFKECLAKVLFKHYEAPSICFISSHLVSLMTLGISSGLVLDCGFSETLVLPIYEGIPLLKAWKSLPFASSALHEYLEAQLMESAKLKTEQSAERPLSSALSSVDPNVLEQIKIKACFVTKMSRAKQIQDARAEKEPDESKFPAPVPSVSYPLDGGKILYIDGKIREHTAELLFERDADEQSLPTLILDAILECPLDIRRFMMQNIVLIGGTCMMAGFKPRLVAELNELKASSKYAHLHIEKFGFHKPPALENYTAWLGGAILGDLEILPSRSVSRDQYLQRGGVPDWSKQQSVEELIMSGAGVGATPSSVVSARKT